MMAHHMYRDVISSVRLLVMVWTQLVPACKDLGREIRHVTWRPLELRHMLDMPNGSQQVLDIPSTRLQQLSTRIATHLVLE